MKFNKKKIILIIIFIIASIIILATGISLVAKKKVKYGYDKNSSIQQILEYYGCEFYKVKNSKESNFKKEIYMSFAIDPIDTNGISKQQEYEKVISGLAYKLTPDNFILKDEKRNIEVRVKFDKEDNIKYLINGELDYFTLEKQRYSIKNAKQIEVKEFNVKSKELINLINNDWSRKKSNLGTIESDCDDYDYYFDEGYKIKTINTKVYNIIFTKQYKNEIIDGIKTSMKKEDIVSKLGEPTFTDGGELIGYKTKNFYVFFYKGEVSIYMPDQYDEESNKEFAELVTNYIEKNDYKTLINKVTEIYTDYTKYTQQQEYIDIIYPQRGFEIKLGTQKSGIYIYQNYKGLITKDITFEDIIQGKETPNNIYLNIDTNIIEKNERIRATSEVEKMIPTTSGLKNEHELYSSSTKYSGVYDSNNKKISFYSLDKESYDSEIKNVLNMTQIYNLSDYEFIYGIKNEGIYYYNVLNKNKQKLLSSNGNCEIEKVENNIIYYDGTKIEIKR